MITRRDFLGGSLALMLPSTVLAGAETFKVDIAVIGSGGAGVCAACSAKEAGAENVVIIEKAPVAGGHTAVSSGTVSAAWEKMQLPKGIIDSPELMTCHMLEVGRDNDPQLVRTLCENSGSALDWMTSLGVRWRPEVNEIYAGKHLRGYRTFNPRSGYDFVLFPLKRFLELGGKIFYDSPVTSITPAEDGFELEVGKGAGPIRVLASKVIIASGGFTENPAMREKYAPGLTTGMPTSCPPGRFLFEGCTGEMIEAAQTLGARLVDMDSIQCIPFVGGRTLPEAGSDIFINAQGERFVQEGCAWKELEGAIRKLPEKSFWVISPLSGRQTMDIERKILSKTIQVAKTLQEAEQITGISASKIQETLDKFNRAVRREVQDPIGVSMTAKPIENPPFFIGKEQLCVHTTLGGIGIDSKARVVRADGMAINGLYACGEVTGGVHGRDKMAGTGMTENFVFGRIAGREAAEALVGKS